MIEDTIGEKLHDRSTRGGTLSPEEHKLLSAWYTQQDQAEASQLKAPNLAKADLAELRTQIDAALARIADITKQIQELTAENEKLRQEVIALRRRVPQFV